MSYDKAIEHGKEHRKQYYGAKSIDVTCRNHGSCTYCEQNRRYQENKQKEKYKQDYKEWKDER